MIQNKIQYDKITERIDELLAVVNNDTSENDKDYIELYLLEVSPSRISEYLSGTTEPTLKVARTMGKKLSIDPHILLGI